MQKKPEKEHLNWRLKTGPRKLNCPQQWGGVVPKKGLRGPKKVGKRGKNTTNLPRGFPKKPPHNRWENMSVKVGVLTAFWKPTAGKKLKEKLAQPENGQKKTITGVFLTVFWGVYRREKPHSRKSSEKNSKKKR